MKKSSQQTPWEILGVDEGSDYEAIRRAFRKKALNCHPDKVKKIIANQTTENVEALTIDFQKLLGAFEALKKELEASGDLALLHECRRSHFKGKGNVNHLSLRQIQRLDSDLYCHVCRCGFDIPIELDEFAIHFEV